MASLRTKLLAIVLIPGLVVLGVGVGVSIDAIHDAQQDEDLAKSVAPAAAGAVAFIPLVEAERRASLAFGVNPSPEARTQLDQARSSVDGLTAQLNAAVGSVADELPPAVQSLVRDFSVALAEVPAMRQRVDAGEASRLDIFRLYNRITEVVYTGTELIAADAIDSEVASDRHTAALLMLAADKLDRGNALAAAAIRSGDIGRPEFDEFVRSYGAALSALDSLLPLVDGADRAGVEEVRSSPEWQQLTQVSDDLIARGFDNLSATDAEDRRSPPVADVAGWERAVTTVATSLFNTGVSRSAAAADLEQTRASEKVDDATLAAILMIIGTLIVFAFALILSTRLVRRLARLRAETLALAQRTLPDTVEKLRAGEDVDVATEIPRLDHGRDEIGQVASAFNQAQQTAVRAAVDEARTRAGINAVFLNIARRSQNIVHRQLQVLDEVERAETDPDQLSLLFQLDHLATRERRNAENLIILGGQQPGRQWRNPVLLTELVRSAIGETEQYQRVTPGRLPRVLVAGKAVGDLVHLLAELVDNATGFSPPDSPIEVSGVVVGRGVVVEVEDHGLGIPADRREELNEILRHPPDFSFMTLTEDSRLGLFVVARLAHRHGMIVTLRESAYGGVRAGVLIPTALLETDGDYDPPAEPSTFDVIDAVAEPTAAEPPEPTITRAPVNSVSRMSVPVAAAPESAAAEPPAQLARPRLHRAQVEEARSPAAAARAQGLPELPRRRRLAHMDSRLRDQVFDESHSDVEVPQQPGPGHSPDTARHRMSAFQQGTRRGRSEPVNRTPAHTGDEGE